VELELDSTSRALYRLESQTTGARDEEARYGGPPDMSPRGELSNGSAGSLLDCRYINDVSVDEVFGDLSGSNSPTPKKILLVTPLKRGPSASSTPSRGSIGDELKEVGGTNLPSPLCEKEPPGPKCGLLQELTRWQESVRRAIIEEAEPSASGRLISALNRAMEATRKEMLAGPGQRGPYEEEEKQPGGELEQLRCEVQQLRTQLNVEREERAQEARRLPDVDMVEARLADMATLLQVTVVLL
jgi:hypothetical protein